MDLLVFIVVAICATCHGRVASPAQTGRDPVVDRIETASGHQDAVVGTDGGAASATSANGGTAEATASSQGGNAATAKSASTSQGAASDHTSQNGGNPTPEMDICSPYACPIFTPVIDPNSRFHKKEFPAGKWLKIKKKAFAPYDGNYFQEISQYIADNIPGAVPVVAQIDCPADHEQRWQTYTAKHNATMEELQQLNNKSNTLLSALNGGQGVSDRIMALADELQLAFNEYKTDFNITVYNYLHHNFQPNPRTPNTVVQPPTPTSPNLTITKQPAFVVIPGFFSSYNPLAESHEMALEFAKSLNVSFTTYYMANYLNSNQEIWFSTDPKTTIFQ